VLAHQNQPEASRQWLIAATRADPNYAPAREFLVELDHPAGPFTEPNAIQRAGYEQRP
jgi:hypothetical protein